VCSTKWLIFEKILSPVSLDTSNFLITLKLDKLVSEWVSEWVSESLKKEMMKWVLNVTRAKITTEKVFQFQIRYYQSRSRRNLSFLTHLHWCIENNFPFHWLKIFYSNFFFLLLLFTFEVWKNETKLFIVYTLYLSVYMTWNIFRCLQQIFRQIKN
jgi:hypothetical protein